MDNVFKFIVIPVTTVGFICLTVFCFCACLNEQRNKRFKMHNMLMFLWIPIACITILGFLVPSYLPITMGVFISRPITTSAIGIGLLLFVKLAMYNLENVTFNATMAEDYFEMLNLRLFIYTFSVLICVFMFPSPVHFNVLFIVVLPRTFIMGARNLGHIYALMGPFINNTPGEKEKLTMMVNYTVFESFIVVSVLTGYLVRELLT